MNIALNTNVVHESEAQRQHARVRLPASLKLGVTDGTRQTFKLKDISAGGFSLEAETSALIINKSYTGALAFVVDALEISLEIHFIVRDISKDTQLVRCEFENLGAQETSTLRHLITSYLNGSIVTMGEVLNTLSRENFTRERKQKGNAGLNFLARFKAATLSTFWFIAGLAAFGLASSQIYDNYFLTKATSAKVIIETINVSMPREGIVNSLITDNQTSVEAGTAIATYKTPLVDALKIEFNSDDPKQAAAINEVLSRSAEGTVSSPCDCEILKSHFIAGEYANKGDALFTLTQQKSKPQISAYFNYKDLEHIQVNQTVHVTVAGSPQTITGQIKSIQMAEDSGVVDYVNTSSVNAIIELTEVLPADFWLRPATVTVAPKTVDKISNWVVSVW
ncbi:MAG: HlyD family efflux transporter periplasmic adaptor subunit [Pseudomonadales bacterium]|nr:HlyD family efflux transporter periplasmic adaptor subunit [Pseudomonadales bacterium]